MTFCMLAFASDGWIMAADQAELNYLGPLGNAVRTQGMATKILYDKDLGLAACFSGDTGSRHVAEVIAREVKRGKSKIDDCSLSKETRQIEIEKIADQALAKIRRQFGIYLPALMREVLLILPSGAVWHLHGVRKIRADAKDFHQGTLYIGDTPNPAVFFPQRYYSAFSPLRRVDEIELLVAHCVLEAHEFGGKRVEGLDMLTYKRKAAEPAAKFHFYDELELANLKTKSAAASAAISNLLFPE